MHGWAGMPMPFSAAVLVACKACCSGSAHASLTPSPPNPLFLGRPMGVTPWRCCVTPSSLLAPLAPPPAAAPRGGWGGHPLSLRHCWNRRGTACQASLMGGLRQTGWSGNLAAMGGGQWHVQAP